MFSATVVDEPSKSVPKLARYQRRRCEDMNASNAAGCVVKLTGEFAGIAMRGHRDYVS